MGPQVPGERLRDGLHLRPRKSSGHSQDFIWVKEVEGGLRRGWGYKEWVDEMRPEGPPGRVCEGGGGMGIYEWCWSRRLDKEGWQPEMVSLRTSSCDRGKQEMGQVRMSLDALLEEIGKKSLAQWCGSFTLVVVPTPDLWELGCFVAYILGKMVVSELKWYSIKQYLSVVVITIWCRFSTTICIAPAICKALWGPVGNTDTNAKLFPLLLSGF